MCRCRCVWVYVCDGVGVCTHGVDAGVCGSVYTRKAANTRVHMEDALKHIRCYLCV